MMRRDEIRAFEYEIERIRQYKSEETRREHMENLYREVFSAGYDKALADLGRAVMTGAVFGRPLTDSLTI